MLTCTQVPFTGRYIHSMMHPNAYVLIEGFTSTCWLHMWCGAALVEPKAFCTSTQLPIAASLKRLASQEINYDSLTGLPSSFAKEAGEHACAGEVPLKSKDGWEIATFAGGAREACSAHRPTSAS